MGDTGYAGKQPINFSIPLSDLRLPASSICWWWCPDVLVPGCYTHWDNGHRWLRSRDTSGGLAAMLPVLPVLPVHVLITAEVMDGVSSDYSHAHSACYTPPPELKIIVLLN